MKQKSHVQFRFSMTWTWLRFSTKKNPNENIEAMSLIKYLFPYYLEPGKDFIKPSPNALMTWR